MKARTAPRGPALRTDHHKWPPLGTMIDALRAARAAYLPELLQESGEWPDRGRAYRSRLVGRIVRDWDRLVANPQPREVPPAYGGDDVRTRNRKGARPMKLTTMFPAKYLRADDVSDEDLQLTIADVTMCHDFEQPKPVVSFAETDKGLVLNKVNAETIAAAYGGDSDGWKGQPVTLFAATAMFQGRSVDAIRIKVPKRKPADNASARAKTKPASGAEIPF
jgi:hypothetical protein